MTLREHVADEHPEFINGSVALQNVASRTNQPCVLDRIPLRVINPIKGWRSSPSRPARVLAVVKSNPTTGTMGQRIRSQVDDGSIKLQTDIGGTDLCVVDQSSYLAGAAFQSCIRLIDEPTKLCASRPALDTKHEFVIAGAAAGNTEACRFIGSTPSGLDGARCFHACPTGTSSCIESISTLRAKTKIDTDFLGGCPVASSRLVLHSEPILSNAYPRPLAPVRGIVLLTVQHFTVLSNHVMGAHI